MSWYKPFIFTTEDTQDTKGHGGFFLNNKACMLLKHSSIQPFINLVSRKGDPQFLFVFGNFYFNITPSATKGCALPPLRMMSRMMVEETGAYCGEESRKMVSIPLSR